MQSKCAFAPIYATSPRHRPREIAHAAFPARRGAGHGGRLVSFGFVNVMQARHPLPADFRARWDAFTAEWAGRPVEEFYRVPDGFRRRRNCPTTGRLLFPAPIPASTRSTTRPPSISFPAEEGWTAPTMLLAHGLMSVSDFGYRLWARRLNARGWNAVFVHLPYHYSRRLPRHFHGEFSRRRRAAAHGGGHPAIGGGVPHRAAAIARARAGGFSADGARVTAAGSWRCSAASSRCCSG